MGDNSNPALKVVVFGNGGVGKSSLVLRFATDTFSEDYLPTIEDCYRKVCMVDSKTALLDILDTAGQDEYSTLRDSWVRHGRGYLLVYTITERPSFNSIRKYRDLILRIKSEEDNEGPIPMVLVGNKCDLSGERKVATEEGQKLANEFGIPFLETSAKAKTNTEECFHTLVREIRAASGNVPAPSTKRSFCCIL